MQFDFATLPRDKRAKLLLSSVVPRPIAWVTTLAPDGTPNAAPFSFFNIMGSEPPVLALGLAVRHGAPKDTTRNIRASGEFVVNLVPHSLAQKMNATAVDVAPQVDELAQAGLTAAPSLHIRPPRIAESPVAMECRVLQRVDLPGGQTIILGEILAMHIHDAAMLDPERCWVDTPGLDLIGRMHGAGWYSRTTDRFEMPRPAELAGHKPVGPDDRHD